MEKSTNWPAWFYGPNGQGQIFASEGDVPTGWQDHPSKVGEKAKAAPPPTPQTPAPATSTPATAPAASVTASDAIVDRDGHPWNADLHASSKSRTKDDLWRMKVGVSRPGPLPGYPKPVAAPLDL